MLSLYLSAWHLGSVLSGSLAPDTSGLVPHTSGSAPPTSLNRALKTASDFTAHCPTPWEVGCVWACSSLGTAKPSQILLSSAQPLLRGGHKPQTSRAVAGREAPWSMPAVGEGWGRKDSLCSPGEGEQLLEGKGGEQKHGIPMAGPQSRPREEGSKAGESLRKRSQERRGWAWETWDREGEEATQRRG